MSPFRKVKQKNGGKWWVPGEEDSDDFSEYVETYLKDWVGFVEETVFEVNMLSIDQNTILVNNYNKKVFDFLEKHHIAPVIAPFRHRWFWDGGVHCVTQDLYRERLYS
jgi:N-dimethylarginine dimethylaminohydrolase